MFLISRESKWASALLATVALLGMGGCGGQEGEATDSAQAAARVDNPFLGVTGYVNPDWRSHVVAEPGGMQVADTPTAIWLRSIASVTGASGGMSLRQHLEVALSQGVGYVEVVLYDLPGRDCPNLTTNGEFQPNEVSRYQTEFVDPIAAVEADSRYAGLRIINIIEPNSLPNLVTNLSTSYCATVQTYDAYSAGIKYALSKLGAIPNAYNYLDIAHHGVLGWQENLTAAVALYVKTIQGATGGFGTVAGFVTNVANYGATVEPFFQASTTIAGTTVRQSKWVDWAAYVDEQSFANAWKTAMTNSGMSSVGMLIDTSRNGWGGPNRPVQASKSTDLNTFVNASRIDRRARVGNWCNQAGAGLGERPKAVDANGIQAYVWIKLPGESDGAARSIDTSKGYEVMCDPSYEAVPTGALPNAPVQNAWFSAEFQELLANVYPPLPATPKDTIPPSAPSGLSVSNLGSKSLTLHWNASTDNVAVVGYDVYSGTSLVASLMGVSVTLDNQDFSSTRSYSVRARDAAGNVSASSNSVTVTLPCCGTPSSPTVPTNLIYKNVTYTTVTLAWTASTDEYGAVQYEIWDGSKLLGVTGETQYDVSGLGSGTKYTLSVRALNKMGMHSTDSATVTFTTQGLTVPPAPANLRWTASGGTVLLCWDSPDGGVWPITFSLYYGSFNLGTFGDSCVALIGFKPGTPYAFTVKTVDANGNVSVASNQVTVLLDIAPDTTAPTAPTTLASTTMSATSVRLTWIASKDDVGVVLYQVYSSGALFQTVAASTSATVTGLTSGKTYQFTVKAVDAAGNASAASNAVTVVAGVVADGAAR